jgi:Kef-type K+ transport system membrane component KefB
VPIFFVLMGLKVDLRLFARLDILGLAAALTAAAILGKADLFYRCYGTRSKSPCYRTRNDPAR